MRALALLALTLCGCPAAHDDFPTTACTSQQDCFQGEICQIESGKETGTCVSDTSRPDGSTP